MLLQHKALGKNISFSSYSLSEELPHVAIVIPVCNEEKVIKEKLDSIFNCSYPLDKLHVYIGLDNCTDASKSIITTNFNFPNLHIIEFTERQGKPSVLNKIIANNVTAEHHLLILTDANVIFNHNTIFELVKYFKESSIGLVDGNIQAKNIDNRHEFDYWNYETLIKINESKLYSKILGPSGACYAIRKSLFNPIPNNFLVDDFYIGFSIITQQNNAIINVDATCVEVSNTNWKQEFNRKVRIAAGNFQNLWFFKKYAFNIFSAIGFMFVSHKVIRWKTPFLLLILYYILLLEFTLFVLIVTFTLPIIDTVFRIFGVEFKPLRQFHYFIVMNIAVFIGFLKFCKGIKSNVWQPTTRN